MVITTHKEYDQECCKVLFCKPEKNNVIKKSYKTSKKGLYFMSNGRFGPKPEKSKNVLSSMSSGGSYLHHYSKKFFKLYEELKMK